MKLLLGGVIRSIVLASGEFKVSPLHNLTRSAIAKKLIKCFFLGATSIGEIHRETVDAKNGQKRVQK